MSERERTIVGKIMDGVGGLIRTVIDNQDQPDKDLVLSQINGLNNYNRGDLVSLELLAHTLNSNTEVRRAMMKGLIQVDGTYDSDLVKDRVDRRALSLVNDDLEDEIVKEYAGELLRRHSIY